MLLWISKNIESLKRLLGWTKKLGTFFKNFPRSITDDKIPPKSIFNQFQSVNYYEYDNDVFIDNKEVYDFKTSFLS